MIHLNQRHGDLFDYIDLRSLIFNVVSKKNPMLQAYKVYCSSMSTTVINVQHIVNIV